MSACSLAPRHGYPPPAYGRPGYPQQGYAPRPGYQQQTGYPPPQGGFGAN